MIEVVPNHHGGFLPLPDSLIGQGLGLACWAAVVALGWDAWRRRDPEGASDALFFGGLWLVIRLGLLLIALSAPPWPGIDWLSVALDIGGLVLLAWPLLSPPLPRPLANQVAGLGLIAVTATCGVALWQAIQATLGGNALAPPPRLNWAHSLLITAALTGLNLRRDVPRRRHWLVTAVGALLLALAGFAFPLTASRSAGSLSAGAAAALAAAWLKWLERPQPRSAPPEIEQSERPTPAPISRLLHETSTLFTASDLPQLMRRTGHVLRPIIDVQQVALLTRENEDSSSLRLAAAWPPPRGPEQGQQTYQLPLEGQETPGEAPGRSHNHISQRTLLEPLSRRLGVDPGSGFILPLNGERCSDGFLALYHNGTQPNSDQLKICRALAGQVSVAAEQILLRRNLTERSQDLARLDRRREHENRQFRAILESVGDGVIVSDANDQVILVNTAALKMLDMERSRVLGQPFGHIIACMMPADDVGIMGTLTESSGYGTEAIFRTSTRVVQTSMAPIEEDGGKQVGVVAVLRDITALVRAEDEREHLLASLKEKAQELEEAAERLRELDRLKSQFIANVSHELRTPLNSIIGFSGVMLKGIDGPLNETQEQDLRAIHNGGKHLLNLINDILDISQIWAGKMKLRFSDVDITELIEEAVTSAIPLVGSKPIMLEQSIEPDLPAIRADQTRVRQVLLNLLSNAIKYTEQGEVTISASRNEEYVIISVTDTGVGIPAEQLDKIFEEFFRVDASSTRTVDGLGLGLSITHRLVKLHGGDIWVESEPGKGSKFSVALPIEGPSSMAEQGTNKRQQIERLRTALSR